jgi:hypothetical protein
VIPQAERWEAVARECPDGLAAAAHYYDRVHTVTQNAPRTLMCKPREGLVLTSGERTSDAIRNAELGGTPRRT